MGIIKEKIQSGEGAAEPASPGLSPARRAAEPVSWWGRGVTQPVLRSRRTQPDPIAPQPLPRDARKAPHPQPDNHAPSLGTAEAEQALATRARLPAPFLALQRDVTAAFAEPSGPVPRSPPGPTGPPFPASPSAPV